MKRRIPLFTLLLLAFAVISCQTESRETSVDLIGPDPINAVFDTPEYAMHTALWWDISDEAIPDIPMVANMGFGWVKQNIAWRDVENIKKGEYDVYRPDRIVEEAEKEGLNLLIRIDRQPLWAQVSQDELIENGPPADYNDFGDFCGWLATRYTGRIAAYQVSNEPNLHREWGGQPPNPTDYTRLLKVCYTAIKAADPDAIVISAGLAPTGSGDPAQVMSDEDFLRGMYAAGAQNYYDVLGVNAPGYKAPPQLDPADAVNLMEDNGLSTYGGHRFFSFRHVEDIRRIMLENGDGAHQIAILEMGWTTDSRPGSPYAWHAVDEQTQADYLVGAYDYARENWSPWVGLMTSLYIGDYAWTEQDEQWWWSIAFPDGSQRPAYQALSDMEKLTASPEPILELIPEPAPPELNMMMTISFWIHLLATVVWLGGILMIAFVAFPAWQNGSLQRNHWLALQKRLTPPINMSIVLIWITGFYQMTQDSHYSGFLTVDSSWAWAMLLKHVAVIAMTALAFWTQLHLRPAYGRLEVLAAQKPHLVEQEQARLAASEKRFLRINLVLALLTLFFTALATAL